MLFRFSFVTMAMLAAACGSPSVEAHPAPGQNVIALPQPIDAGAAPRVDAEQLALANALGACARGSHDDVLAVATEKIAEMARDGSKLDRAVVDGLWACFASYRISSATALRQVQGIHDAILAIDDPSYASKAAALIDAADADLAFGQTTAIQVIKQQRYKPAARSLAIVLMTQSKASLDGLAAAALATMPNEAVPILASALAGTDPEFAKLAGDWADKGYVPLLIDALASTSIDSARAAIALSIPQLDTDAHRAHAAAALVWFPATPELVATFKRIYEKLRPIARDGGLDRANVLGVTSEFFDPSLALWALSEAANAKGDHMGAARLTAVHAAIRLMRPEDKDRVDKALKNVDGSIVGTMRDTFDAAVRAIDQCASRASCYVDILGEPLASSSAKAIKAAYMAGMLGNESTRKGLVARLPKVTNAGVRQAMAVAINHLAPTGDTADADALEKIVADDKARGDSQALAGDAPLMRVAAMLRARSH